MNSQHAQRGTKLRLFVISVHGNLLCPKTQISEMDGIAVAQKISVVI
jgi:hypothetical protein